MKPIECLNCAKEFTPKPGQSFCKSKCNRRQRRRGWRKVRCEAIERDGGQCIQCGSSLSLEGHHRVYVALGGENLTDNVDTLCKPCHIKRHQIEREEYLETWFKKYQA